MIVFCAQNLHLKCYTKIKWEYPMRKTHTNKQLPSGTCELYGLMHSTRTELHSALWIWTEIPVKYYFRYNQDNIKNGTKLVEHITTTTTKRKQTQTLKWNR